MNWDDYDVFCHVIEHRGFTAAAHALERPKSSVSAAVVRLETALGARLLERTTRRVRLTEPGQALYQRIGVLFTELHEARADRTNWSTPTPIRAAHIDRRRILRLLPAVCGAIPLSRVAAVLGAQDYPNRPMRLIVPHPPGSAVDVYARRLALPLSRAFGQSVFIDNRPGAAGRIGVYAGAKASADGYTIVIGTSSNLAVLPALGAKLPYDPLTDFEPITQFTRSSLVLVANPALGVATTKELIARAKSQQTPLLYGTSGTAGIGHLAGELFRHEAGIRLTHVPYKAPVVLAVLGNEVPLGFEFAVTTCAHIRTGKLRALFVTGRNRTVSLPEVPTVAECGLPGAEIYGWGGFLAPAGTSRDIVFRLHREIVAALHQDEMKIIFDQEGSEVVGSLPEEFRALIASEQAQFARIIKLSGIKLEEM